MTINITARGTTVRDPFKKSLEKKLTKLDRFFEDEVNANVTVSTQNGRETVEVTIKSGGMVFRSEKTAGDRLDALDVVVDSLFRQIVKNKTKLEKRLRKTAFAPEHKDDFIGAEPTYEIAKSKKFTVKPMDVEEAILQMNLIGHNFYMYRDSELDEICVVYKRNDGGYGVLEPDSE